MSGISRAAQLGALLSGLLKLGQGMNMPLNPNPGVFDPVGPALGRGRNRTPGPPGEAGDKLRKRFAKVSTHPGPRGY